MAVMHYVATVGIDVDQDRYEPGDTVPAAVVKHAPWLLEQGWVEAVK